MNRRDLFTQWLPDPDASSEPHVVRGEGEHRVTFFKRRTGTNSVWAFKRIDVDRVAQLAGVRRREGKLPPLGVNEISVSAKGLRAVFIGRLAQAAQRITRVLLVPPEREAVKALSDDQGTVAFFTRKHGPRTVWAFNQADAPKVAHLFGLRLREIPIPRLGPEEIPLVEAMPGAVVATGPEAAQRLHQLLGEPPSEPTTKKLGEGEDAVAFVTRTHGNQVVWTFNVADAERVLRLTAPSARVESGTVSVPRLQPPGSPAEVFRVLQHAPGPLTVTDIAQQLGRAITTIQQDLSALAARGLIHRNGPTAILATTYTLSPTARPQAEAIRNLLATLPRARPTREDWTRIEPQLEDLLRHDGAPRQLTSAVPALGGDEVAVSGPSLARVFVGQSSTLARAIRGHLPDLYMTLEPTVTLDTGAQQVTFVKRQSGVHLVWAFKQTEASKVAALFGLRLKESLAELRADEVACSVKGFRHVFRGDGRTLARAIRARLPDVHTAPEPTFTLGKTVQQVTFVKRLHGSRLVWAFPQADVSRVAVLFGFSPRSPIAELGADEVACSALGLASVFVGESVRTVRLHLPNVHTSPELTVTFGEETSQVTFVKRRTGGGQIVWAFQRTDTPKVAALFGWWLKESLTGLSELGADEVACSVSGMALVFVGNPDILARAIRQHLPDILTSPDSTFTLGEGAQQVTFIKRRTSNHLVWAFKQADASKIAEILGFPLRTQVPILELAPDEVACSNSAGVPRP